MAHEEPRLGKPVIQVEVLDEDSTVRKVPIVIVGNRDVLAFGQAEPAVLRRAVGPERGVQSVRDQAVELRRASLGGVNAARFGKQVRNIVAAVAGGEGEAADRAALVVEDVQLAVGILAKG
jgi:hypothetical protein